MRSLGLALALLLALAPPAAAQEAAPGADAYTQRVQQGIALLVSGDTGGSMGVFRQAIQSDGNRPEAIYYLACANRMTGNLQDAVTGFERAADVAEGQPRWRARALAGVAMTLERMHGRTEDARAAWQAYVQFADANAAVAHPQLGRARIQAVDMMAEQERAYVAVRERIEARERENASSGSSSRR